MDKLGKIKCSQNRTKSAVAPIAKGKVKTLIMEQSSSEGRSAMKVLRECKYLKKIVYITSRPKVAVENFLVLAKPCGTESYLGKYFVPLLAIPFDLSPQTEHFGVAVMFQRL